MELTSMELTSIGLASMELTSTESLTSTEKFKFLNLIWLLENSWLWVAVLLSAAMELAAERATWDSWVGSGRLEVNIQGC